MSSEQQGTLFTPANAAESLKRAPTAAESEHRVEPPPNWGKDHLSRFIDLARHNQFATFHNHRKWFERWVGIDDCYLTIAKDWINPRNLVTPLLLLRAHSSFRAACQLTAAGQVTEAFPSLRACLEYSGYANHINRNPSLAETWLRRHDDEGSLKRMKSEFTIAKVSEGLRMSNRHACDRFESLYQRTIDHGGHPNEMAVTGSMMMKKEEDRQNVFQHYLHGDGLPLLHGLKTTTQIGLVSLEIFNEVFGPRFELLGVKAWLLDARNTFEQV